MKNILPIQMLGMFGKKSLQQLVGVWSIFFLYLAFDPIWSAQDVFQIDGSPTETPNMDDMNFPALKWVV